MTGYKTVVGMVKGMLEELNITVPVALHLDHGSYEGCLKCVEAGFTSIMFDGSHYTVSYTHLDVYKRQLQDLFFVLADSKSADLASVVHNPRFSPCLISSLWSI